jgi:nucleoside phosphorylase
MTELLYNDPCVLFALAREASHFYREFKPHQRFPAAPCHARFCGPAWLTVLVLESGVGAHATDRALDWIGSSPRLGRLPYRPKVILSAGYCGALQEHLRVGDIVFAEEVVDASGRCWPATWPAEPLQGEWRPPLHRGRLLTAPDLAADPDQKRELGRQHGAAAVDMETARVARFCAEHDIPFASVRAVSDDARMALSPRLAALLSGGRVSPLRLAGGVARQPRLVAELWRLARHTRLASAQLALALGELLTLTLPWAADR